MHKVGTKYIGYLKEILRFQTLTDIMQKKIDATDHHDHFKHVFYPRHTLSALGP